MIDRTETRLDAAVGAIVVHGGKSQPFMTRNISRGGMFIATAKPWPMGTVVQVQLIHQNRKIQINARASRITPEGVGFNFIDASPEMETAIDSLIKELLNKNSASMSPAGDIVTASIAARLIWSANEVIVAKGPALRSAAIINLSPDGAAVMEKTPPPIGSDLTVSFMPQLAGAKIKTASLKAVDHGPVTCKAKVVRHTETGFAIKFMAPTTDFKITVSRLRKNESTDFVKASATLAMPVLR